MEILKMPEVRVFNAGKALRCTQESMCGCSSLCCILLPYLHRKRKKPHNHRHEEAKLASFIVQLAYFSCA